MDQNGNSIQQLLREIKGMDFSITSENVLDIKNTVMAGDSIVGDIKSNNDVDVKCFSGATIIQLIDNLRNIPDQYNELILMIGTNECSGAQEISSILKQYELLLDEAHTIQFCQSGWHLSKNRQSKDTG